MAGGTCKGCGSLLPLPDSDGAVACPSCGRTFRAPPPTPPETEPAPTEPVGPYSTWTPDADPLFTTATRSTGRASRSIGVGCLISVLVLVGGLVAAVVGFRSVSEEVGSAVSDAFEGRSTSSLTPAGRDVITMVPLPGEGPVVDGAADAPVEVVTSAYDGRANRRFLARVRLGADRDTAVDVWRSEPFPASVYDARLALAGDTVFAGVGDEVWAVQAGDGTVAWKATLPDTVTSSCPDCFVVVGDTLVVRTSDAQLAAFGAGSAEPRWTRRLVAPTGRFVVGGGGLAVVDDLPDPPNDTVVHVLDPASGAVRSTFRPECTVPGGSWATTLNFTDRVYAVPGTEDFVATLSFGSLCVVRWNGGTGQPVWTAPVADVSSVDSDTALLAGDRLVLPSRSGEAVAVDLSGGQVTRLASPADVRVRPVARRDTHLVAVTETTRGTPKAGLLAWDLATGQVAWQVAVPGGGGLLDEIPTSSPAALFSGTVLSAVAADARGDGLALVTFDGDTGTVAIRRLDPATGALGEATTAPLGGGSGIPSVQVHRATAGAVLFAVDGRLLLLRGDQRTGWPA